MRELSKKLHKKIEKIEEGELSLEELEEVVGQAHELYERLLILRYKAYEKYGEPDQKTEKSQHEEIEEEGEKVPVETRDENQEEAAFDFSGITEEVEQPSFDFAVSEESTETEEEKEEIFPEASDTKSEVNREEEETFPEADEVKAKKDVFKDSHVERHEPEDQNSLNQKLGSEEALSLRKKLQSTPVKNLKDEISIAKKFEYITFMFEGKSGAYEKAIEELNNCADGEEAKNKLNEYSSKYNWDLENKSIIKFVELVERRYL